MKNQFEITLYDSQSFFEVNDNDMVRYKPDEETKELTPVTVRLSFTDTVDQIRAKLRQELSLREGSQFNMLEVRQLTNDFCHLLNPLSQMQGDKLAKDCDFEN